jgi:TonB dependent receptor.
MSGSSRWTTRPRSRLAKPLQEETSFNLSAGLVVTPIENFTLTADYFRIKINNQILLGATFDDSVTVAS